MLQSNLIQQAVVALLLVDENQNEGSMKILFMNKQLNCQFASAEQLDCSSHILQPLIVDLEASDQCATHIPT